MTTMHSHQSNPKSEPSKSVVSPVRQVRAVPPLVRLILFVSAGGRCEFDGCNKFLLAHHVTLTTGNFAEVAHIVAFRLDGPRGKNESRTADIHQSENLMLLCPGCHKLVDDHPKRYPVPTLKKYKENHERHIHHMTSLRPEFRTSVLIVTANIGEQGAFIPFDQVIEALAPRYPVSKPGKLIDLTPIPIHDAASLETAREAIRRGLAQIYDTGGEAQTIKHLSVFALAPIPLLVDLGARLSNKIPTDFYQRHRDTESWTWKQGGAPVSYTFGIAQQGSDHSKVALMMSLSGKLRVQDLPSSIDENFTVYEFTLKDSTPNPAFLKTRADLDAFRTSYQALLGSILDKHGIVKELHLFPAVPAPVAILCGRELLPKVHPCLLVYDFDKQKGGFTFQLKVNAHGRERISE
jgi:hypothetical protein